MKHIELNINITKIHVMLTDGPDKVSIRTNGYKPPFPVMKDHILSFDFECLQDSGVSYVLSNFRGISYDDIKVINARSKR